MIYYLLALPTPAPTQDSGSFSGVMVGVSDGDTTEVLRSGHTVRVRQNGVDAPELHQALEHGPGSSPARW